MDKQADNLPAAPPTPTLLAIDIGIKTGFALYGHDGRLHWYRSQNFGSATRLRRAVRPFLNEIAGLAAVVMEGGGELATIWQRELHRRPHIHIIPIHAETWRTRLLYAREQRSSVQAKFRADELARRIIAWSQAPRPTALQDDTAEAILIGLWGVLELGCWSNRPPPCANEASRAGDIAYQCIDETPIAQRGTPNE